MVDAEPLKGKINRMEKTSPHYALSVMQQAIAAAGHGAFTQTALAGGRYLGLTVAYIKLTAVAERIVIQFKGK